MKIKAKVKKPERWKSGTCAMTSRLIMKMQCGVAFAQHQFDQERIKQTGVKSILREDVVPALRTTAMLSSDRLVGGNWDPRAKPYLKKAFAANTRIMNVIKNGPEKIPLKDAPEFSRKILVVWNAFDDA